MTDSTAREHVLIVDDEPPIVSVLVRTLQRAGYNVAAAFNADEAFNVIEQRTPDVVLLDADLPVVGGLEICRILRAKPATRLTPILFITGTDTNERRFEATQAGVDGFLGKPFDTATLLERIHVMLSAKHHVDDFRLLGC
jgi:DNA-binding response OmpR family regulator